MSGLVMITGATGELGRRVVEFLLQRVPAGRIAALARRPEDLSDLAARGVLVRRGDYEDPDGLVPAFDGVEKLLLISARAFTDAETAHRNVIHAAKAAGARHLHYTAVQRRAGSDVVIPQATQWDEYTERELAASGLDVTVLRNSMYLESFDMLIGELAPDRVIRVPAGRTPTALATRADMAEATAAVLATDGHAGRGYSLAGSRTFTLDDVATTLGEISGAPVTYQDTPVEDYVAARVQAGMPDPWARFTAAWFQAVAAGEFTPTTDIEHLTGRPPTSLRAFLTHHRSPQPAQPRV
ncbi:SDR family oxidoreductase [Actinacidiphila acididurans]|uniref:SDR family oxidoreductase n=1 Tax=Actinacidiphila acididurans TaxID=2784346 RepID=A0ABS2U1L4_9ACTN|nr:SDR family oxidoreductase [Actinacidiphila acididurans]MBM9509475.1 SDR family oxidoreductase [Actinacidiphila acididurans]